MRGILLAGGTGSRLWPLTQSVNKHLLPVFDKPLIYYPLSTLMLAGIQDILIICNDSDLGSFEGLFGSGQQLGLNITYKIQKSPKGIVDAFRIGEEFVEDHNVALILGDNIFYGSGLGAELSKVSNLNGATILTSEVADPTQYGVVEFDTNFKIVGLHEKPVSPKSTTVITGLYFFDDTAIEKSKNLVPSERGEVEIISLLEMYLKENKLNALSIQRGATWLDAGTPESLLVASNLVKSLQDRRGMSISCPEEIAWRNGWITTTRLIQTINSCQNEHYGNYLLTLIQQ